MELNAKQLFLNKPDSIEELIEGVTAEAYGSIKTAIELGKWDDGTSLTREQLEKVFEPLFTTKKLEAGTGIGLALCHRVVEAHGGSIVAEGASGEGAIFAIRLPRAEEAKSPAASIRQAMDAATKCRVLGHERSMRRPRRRSR